MKYNELELYSQRLDAIVESAHDGIISVNKQSHITFMNMAARKMFGYSPEQAANLHLDQLVPDKSRHNHGNYVQGFRSSQERARSMHTRTSVMGMRLDGSEFPVEISISKIVVNGVMETVAVMRDTSERSKLFKELKEAATLDHLTGLANKRLFNEELARQIALSKRYHRNLSLVLSDLDHFKSVNDQYGHAFGDEVLKAVAGLIKERVRESDVAARWGGEEFALLLPETELSSANNLAEKLRRQIQDHPFVYQQQEVKVTSSFGVVQIDLANDSVENLFERADKLLYKAKNAGRNCVFSED